MVTYQMQYSYDYFDFFHDRHAPSYPGAANREFYFVDLPVPQWSRDKKRDPSFDEFRRISFHNTNAHFHQYDRRDGGTGHTLEPAIQQRLEGLGVQVGRILGAGSQGVAIAVKFGVQQMVVKYSKGLDDGELYSMITEMWAMRMSKGAQHIIQVSDIYQFCVHCSRFIVHELFLVENLGVSVYR